MSRCTCTPGGPAVTAQAAPRRVFPCRRPYGTPPPVIFRALVPCRIAGPESAVHEKETRAGPFRLRSPANFRFAVFCSPPHRRLAYRCDPSSHRRSSDGLLSVRTLFVTCVRRVRPADAECPLPPGSRCSDPGAVGAPARPEAGRTTGRRRPAMAAEVSVRASQGAELGVGRGAPALADGRTRSPVDRNGGAAVAGSGGSRPCGASGRAGRRLLFRRSCQNRSYGWSRSRTSAGGRLRAGGIRRLPGRPPDTRPAHRRTVRCSGRPCGAGRGGR